MGIPASFDRSTVDAALEAIKDGQLRMISPIGETAYWGRVWEIYRSITTDSIRIRCSDPSGMVHHYNSHDVRMLRA